MQRRTDSLSHAIGRVEQPRKRATLCAAHSHASVRINVGSHQVFSCRATDVDFPGSGSDDLRPAARARHAEGRTNGDARGRKVARFAAAGAERATGHSGYGSDDGFEALGGAALYNHFSYEIATRFLRISCGEQ